PSGSVSPVTRPNSVSTPTFPVGMEVVLAINTMMTTTNIPSCNILLPAPPRFGIDGNPPPRSNLVVVGIFSPSAAHSLGNRVAQPLLLIRRKRTLDFPAGPPIDSIGPRSSVRSQN